MDELQVLKTQDNEIKKYLVSGTQTQVTPTIEKISSKILGTTLEKVQKILDICPSVVESRNFNKKIFRKRTADQILKDGYITGCTDAALLFITFARASGIPAKYIETIDEEWLRNGGGSISGHIYSQIYDINQDKWIWVDPMRRKIGSSPEKRVIFQEGLDSWDIGITDFDSLKTKFEEFRKHWLLENSYIVFKGFNI